MKAAVLTGIRKVEICEIPKPALDKKSDVLVRVSAVGLCGSDIHYYHEGRIGDQVVAYPFIVGHECAGVIEEAGSSAHGLKPGSRVAVDPAVVCRACDQCLAGRPNTCRRLLFLGTPGQLEGCLSEFIVIPAENCYPLEEGVTFEEGVLAEPLSIGIHSFRLLDGLVPQKIAILGAGPIGLSVLLTAHAYGVSRIYATDKVDARVTASRTAGASWSGNPDQEDIVAEIARQEPGQLDAVFECSGDPSALDQAVDLLRPGGKLMILGIPAGDRVSFDVHKLRRKEIALYNVRRQRHCYEEALDLIRTKKTDVRFLATHEFRLEEAAEAFELAANYRDGVIKAIVRNG
ncbi:MAG: alcohol dehydrogenase catalytic domain-containing protein [Clostridiales bacterium]|nr:alcohol dehydrogenase catalytic domain-containing protein [Clostridiales bacterium]